MAQPPELSSPAQDTHIEENRIAAVKALVAELPAAGVRLASINQPLYKAKLHSMVHNDDAEQLKKSIYTQEEIWNSQDFARQLWYSALIEGKPRTFEALCELSKNKAYSFNVAHEMDEVPEALQLWAMNIPLARNMWLSRAEPLSARKGYGLFNGLKVLESNDAVKTLHAELAAKPQAFHAGMRLFIEEFAMQTLMKNGTFLHTIAYYREPSKKHLRVAATGTEPVYDLERMEQHWPGIQDCIRALTGLGLTTSDCQERLRKMVSNKHADVQMKATEQFPLPGDLEF